MCELASAVRSSDPPRRVYTLKLIETLGSVAPSEEPTLWTSHGGKRRSSPAVGVCASGCGLKGESPQYSRAVRGSSNWMQPAAGTIAEEGGGGGARRGGVESKR